MAERGFLLTPTYRMVAGRPEVHLHAVLENGEPALVVDDRLAPYLFVRQAAGQGGAPGKMRGMASHRTRLAALPMAAVLLLSTVSAEADAARARKALDDRYIPFTPKEFVARAERDEIETVKLFLEAGMAVGAANEAGRTALHGAAGRGDGKLLTVLLAAGAPVNARTREGNTPLCVAVEADYPSNVADLLAARADATIPCARGATMLHVTARRGSRQSIAAALLRAGAPADARDSDGRTPLLLLADRDVVPMLRALVAGGADVNAAGKDGRTALHVALDTRRIPNAEALLQSGARVDLKDAQGETALHVAARQDVVEMIPRLLEKGADPRVRDRHGDTPLATARRYYRVRAEDLLRDATPR